MKPTPDIFRRPLCCPVRAQRGDKLSSQPPDAQCSTVIMRALRTELFSKMQKLPIRYFDANTHGSLMSYFTNDIEATNELLQHAITQMLISVTLALGTIGMMLALSMKLFSHGRAGRHRGHGRARHHEKKQLCLPPAAEGRGERQRLCRGNDRRPARRQGLHPRKAGHAGLRAHQRELLPVRAGHDRDLHRRPHPQ